MIYQNSITLVESSYKIRTDMFDFVKKMLALLSARERRQLYWLIGFMLLLAAVEVASVGSIMPFMTAVSNPETVLENKWAKLLFDALQFKSQNSFLLGLGFFVLFALVISNICTALITWWIFHYSWMRNHSIARRLFRKYLHEPYVFFLNRNTAELEKNILDEIQLVIVGILNSLLMVFKNSMVILLVIALLIVVDPFLAVIVSMILGGAYFILFRYSSKMLRRIGWERAEANVKRFKYVSEALEGIKVLRVLGREDYFLDKFSEHSYTVSRNFAKKSVIAQLPRYAFEIIAFGGVLIIILYFLASGKNVEQVIPILSLYAFAGYRLMPAMQMVFNKAANIRYIIPSLDILYRDTQATAAEGQNDESALTGKTRQDFENRDIYLRNISFSYPGQSEHVIKDLNITIKKKTMVGFAGATGSGKTTIIDIILGLLKPTEGELCVGDVKINASNMSQWQSKLGYVPQDIFLTDESIANNIALGIDDSEIDHNAIIRAAKVAEIHEFIENELAESYATVVGERGVRLSGGQKQRIGIARALYHDPDVLILDEATSALDGVTEDAIMQAIQNISHKRTIIIIAHRITTLQECDHIYVLEKGRVIDEGCYKTLMEKSGYFKTLKSVGQKRAD